MFKTHTYEKGCPSALTRYTGNLQVLTRKLRQAFYYRIGVNFTVQESFIDWDPEKQNTYWTKDEVESDYSLMLLLTDPITSFEYFLPHVSRPSHATDLQWNNHLFGLAVIVCDFIATLRDEPLHLSLEYLRKHLIAK